MVHIVSWNVAGLSTTLKRIDDDFGGSSASSSAASLKKAKAQQEFEAEAEAEAPGGDSLNNNNNNNTKKNDAKTKTKKSAIKQPQQPQHKAHALEYYLDRHGGIDILCMQEHKIPKHQLSSRSEPFSCASLPNYDTYWACCTHASSKGMNGVCTFVRRHRGVNVLRASSTLLQDDDLDSQGRCLMTDHGSFMVVNVYVPQGGSCGLGMKLKFLQKLRLRMQELRTKYRKPVILVGDLNIAHQPQDVFWRYRMIRVDRVLAQVLHVQHMKKNGNGHGNGNGHDHDNAYDYDDFANTQLNSNGVHGVGGRGHSHGSMIAMPKWKLELAQHWATIVQTLEDTKQAVPVQTKNKYTGETFDKFHTVISVNVNVGVGKSNTSKSNNNTSKSKTVILGKARDTEEEALGAYNPKARSYTDADNTKLEKLARHANVIDIDSLVELMSKIVNVQWTTPTQRLISSSSSSGSQGESDNDNDNGIIYHSSPTIHWMDTLLSLDNKSNNKGKGGDHMVDAFRLNYPEAQGRFTCWHQYFNRRYDNEGSRIDYTLVDQPLVKYVRQGINGRMLDCGSLSPQKCNPLGEEAALHACTASGGYQAASFDGTGLMGATQETLEQQFGNGGGGGGSNSGAPSRQASPHTGMIYTPPSYSDHIAVSLLLSDDVLTQHHDQNQQASSTTSNIISKQEKAATKKAQPHLAQSSITTFFNNRSSSTGTTTSGNGNSNTNGSTNVKNMHMHKPPKFITSSSTSSSTTKNKKNTGGTIISFAVTAAASSASTFTQAAVESTQKQLMQDQSTAIRAAAKQSGRSSLAVPPLAKSSTATSTSKKSHMSSRTSTTSINKSKSNQSKSKSKHHQTQIIKSIMSLSHDNDNEHSNNNNDDDDDDDSEIMSENLSPRPVKEKKPVSQDLFDQINDSKSEKLLLQQLKYCPTEDTNVTSNSAISECVTIHTNGEESCEVETVYSQSQSQDATTITSVALLSSIPIITKKQPSLLVPPTSIQTRTKNKTANTNGGGGGGGGGGDLHKYTQKRQHVVTTGTNDNDKDALVSPTKKTKQVPSASASASKSKKKAGPLDTWMMRNSHSSSKSKSGNSKK
jgi:exonuclease III